MQKLALAEWSIDRRGAEAIQLAAQLGFDGIHLGINSPGEELNVVSPGWIDQISRAVDAHNVEIFCIAVNVVEKYGLFDPTGLERCKIAVNNAISVAKALRVPMVYVPSFHRSEIIKEEDLVRAASFFREICSSLGACDINVASENTLDGDENLRLLAEVDHPAFRILLDVYNPILWNKDPCSLIMKIGSGLATQVHVKDGKDGRMGNVGLGLGDGSLGKTLECLRSKSFAEILVLENDYLFDPLTRVRNDVRYLNQLFPEACERLLSRIGN